MVHFSFDLPLGICKELPWIMLGLVVAWFLIWAYMIWILPVGLWARSRKLTVWVGLLSILSSIVLAMSILLPSPCDSKVVKSVLLTSLAMLLTGMKSLR